MNMLDFIILIVLAVEAYQENASWLDLVTPERSC